jgi:hypothetical protein
MVGAGPMGPALLVMSKPVAAATEGCAVAGDFEFALWCDLRMASESTSVIESFGLSDADLCGTNADSVFTRLSRVNPLPVLADPRTVMATPQHVEPAKIWR